MGQLRKATLHDQKQFPGSNFAAHGLVPLPQCTDSLLDGQDGVFAVPLLSQLAEPGAFAGQALVGMNVVIDTSTPPQSFTSPIIGRNDDFLVLFFPGIASTNVHWHIEANVPPNISGTIGVTSSVDNSLNELGKFQGFEQIGQICRITASPTGNPGDYIITNNFPNKLFLDADPGNSNNVEWELHPNPDWPTQRTAEEIMKAAQSQGLPTIRKGGQVFIDGALVNLHPACSILINPQ